MNAEGSARGEFLLSSRPLTGIRSSPISGPRSSLLARSRRGSRCPASAGPIPVRTLSGSRAAAEQSDPELRSFCWILKRGDKRLFLRNSKVLLFVFVSSASSFTIPPGDNLFLAATSTCRLASTSLRSLGFALATSFLLSTTSLGGSDLASSTLPHILVGIRVRYYLVQRKQQQHFYSTKLGLLPCYRYIFCG